MPVDIEGVTFDDSVEKLVRDVIAEAKRLAGSDCIYRANKQIRGALISGDANQNGRGVFVVIEPNKGGATVVRPHIPSHGSKRTELTSKSIADVITNVAIWHQETKPIEEPDEN
jgi:hypothetical protein